MALTNNQIAALLVEMADLLELEGANRFRVRAYRNAAVTIEELPRPLSELIAEGADLTVLPAIGEDLAETLLEINETGTFTALEELRGSSPATLRDLLQIPGLGPKRVQALYDELGIATLDDLEAALDSGAIETVSGFGAKTVQNLREAVLVGRRKKQRHLRADVEDEALALERFLQGLEGVAQGRVGGSFRRKRETVADFDCVATSDRPAEVIERFVEYDEIQSVVAQGETRATVLLKSGIPVDLRVVAPESWGAALMYFTGSRAHQLLLRDIALVRGWKLNEYGLFAGDERLASATEEEVYAAYGMAYVPPELRENRGEIEAARAGALPELIKPDDVRGDLHVTPGSADAIEPLARAAAERGYDYLLIAGRLASKRDAGALRKLAEECARLNEELDGLALFTGVEVEVLEDGAPAVDGDDLDGFDLVIMSLENDYGLSRDRQTSRMLRALEHPRCGLLARLTGRIINERDPRDADVARVLEAARDAGCAVELDGDPRRLDLPDRHCQLAREIGVPVALVSRASRPEELERMRYAVDHARRGWLEAGDTLNARPLAELRKALR